MLGTIAIILLIVGLLMAIFNDGEESIWVIGIILFVVGLIIGVFTAFLYVDSYSEPEYYIGICDSIEETKELLLRYENTTDISMGLEALELKHTLSNLISRKNDHAAYIRQWLRNPIMPFKNILIEGLDDYATEFV